MPFTPIIPRLYPETWPQVIEHTVILIMVEFPVSLKQSETPGIFVNKAVVTQCPRIYQWPPDPLSCSCVHTQTIGIVNLRAPVMVYSVVIFSCLIHAGQGCDTDSIELCPWVECNIDIHDKVSVRVQYEGVSTGNTGRIQQCPYSQRAGLLFRLLQPKRGKAGKLLTARVGGVYRQPPRRQAVLSIPPYGTEVARPQKSSKVIFDVGMIVQPESGKAEVFGQIP